MKTVQVRKNAFLFLGALSFLTVLLSGCLKEAASSTSPVKTFVSLLHLAPKAPSVEVYFDNTKASSAITAGSVSPTYSALDPAIFAITFKKASSDSVVASLSTASYDSLKHYTLVLYNPDSMHVSALRMVDDFSPLVDVSKTHYRFFHLAPEIGPVDVYLNTTKIESSREYADIASTTYYNQFFQVSPNTYDITVKKAGTDSVIAQTYSVTMGGGYAYTLYLKGLTGKTGTTALGVDYLMASD
ncbi:hypothetical protein A3860_25750 [Niastella vici]|uniref:DUF4397 domain-containing protein n=1 Tax=Niastella vici TaxID=1703345 RepID=A0A1V9FYI6_9BACT|nr:hypothetical protein A3860_25750 [Niastella vici]